MTLMNAASRIRTLALLGFVMLLLSPLGGCTTNPATGKRSFTLYSWDKEKQLGLSAAPQMTEAFGGEVPDARVNDYTHEVGMKLVQGVEDGVPDLDWEFTLLNSDVINAFALPGGKIFLSRGLAEQLDSEAELAGVLGHEIGHVTARHANQQMSAQFGMNIALGAAAIVVGTSENDSKVRRYGQIGLPAVAVGGNLFLLKFGRDEELEADMLGMRYMSRAGYNPEGQLKVMQVLRDASSGSGAPPEFFSTHPHPDSRIDRINELLSTRYTHTRNDPAYVMGEGDYERRMLAPLRSLGPAPKSETTMLNPALWCSHCAGGH